MIDNYLLEELVTFAQEKTLAKTAEKLMVTQPTVTRGMQKLEDELGVKLFNRQPNRIELTATGKLAAERAQKVLETNTRFVEQIRNYAVQQRIFNVATVAPGPQLILRVNKDQMPNQIEIADSLLKPADVTPALLNNQYSLVITNEEIQTPEIESRYLGTEKLFVNLDKFMYLANMQKVSFQDLKGLSFVVVSDIGPWKDIIQENIPDAKFLYQGDIDSLNEITRYSNFPYFSTDVTMNNAAHDDDDDRVTIPITDDAATMTFYASYLKSQKRQLAPLIKKLGQVW